MKYPLFTNTLKNRTFVRKKTELDYLRQNSGMVVFPNAKINIGLHIINKREDGYHNLESIFYPIGLCDILEIQKSTEFRFTQSGLEIKGNQEQNLVTRAYTLMREKFGIGAVNIHLHKVIPMGSGLGGGSADATFALKALNQLFNLGLGETELLELALVLGSDCPFFVYNVPCRVTGRGENLEKTGSQLKNFWVKVVHSGLHVSTKDAFRGVTPRGTLNHSEPINLRDIFSLPKRLKNDFEINLFTNYPVLSALAQKLRKEKALYVSLTGSGSALYGIFEHEPARTNLSEFEYIGRLTF
jgi:4-diphosphocytidyl-2-C-methyl-D-erythritol kinase